MEGVLVHVNIDPTSANYLADTVVYDFFDYEVGQGSYCKSIRVGNLERPDRDGLGQGRVGQRRRSSWRASGRTTRSAPRTRPTSPATAIRGSSRAGPRTRSTGGCSRSARPTAADLSKPWTFALGYDRPGPARARAPSIRSSPWGGRSTGTRTAVGLYPSGVRWTTSGPGSGGQMYFSRAGTELGTETLLGGAAPGLQARRTAPARHVRELHRPLFRPPRLHRSAGPRFAAAHLHVHEE